MYASKDFIQVTVHAIDQIKYNDKCDILSCIVVPVHGLAGKQYSKQNRMQVTGIFSRPIEDIPFLHSITNFSSVESVAVGYHRGSLSRPFAYNRLLDFVFSVLKRDQVNFTVTTLINHKL